MDSNFENHLIPFLWVHGEDHERILSEIEAIEKSNIHDLCVESRPHPDFLKEKWWQDMDFIMEQCRKRDIGVWLLDDKRFPTGYAAGMAAESEHRKLVLKEKHVDIKGPQKGNSILIDTTEGFGEQSHKTKVAAVVAARRIKGVDMDHSTHINIYGDAVDSNLHDLTNLLEDDVVYWDIPEGLWRIFIITISRDSGNEWHDKYLNPLTAEGTQILIDTVYNPHYERYSNDFGATFKGFFSDEPQFGNAYGYHAALGKFPFMALPWSDEMTELMDDAAGEESRKYWPGLWYDIGEKTSLIRYSYMDTASRLYGRNFAEKIGDWCRAHGVEYMGHVIEENNAHARLGAGAGHYFRALWGQDFAGIDVVLHDLIPGIKGGSHTAVSQFFEKDDDFFYYMLAQMASSLAHIDPKKKGRAICEIFGAYGWQEGLRQMKWLADFMMVRGINYFVPHAFSPKEFPDPDCPPHFYADGENPQYRYFHILNDYMNRICAIISGGEHLASAAVLYHAEAEWMSGEYMKTQEPVKILNQNQIEADILPVDILENATVEQGEVILGGGHYKAIIVPFAQALPDKAIKVLEAMASRGASILFVNGFPQHGTIKDMNPASRLGSAGCETIELNALAEKMTSLGARRCSTQSFEPDLKMYPYSKEGCTYFLLFNENVDDIINTKLSFADERKPYIYDALKNKAYKTEYTTNANSTEIEVSLNPYEMQIVVFGGSLPDNALEEKEGVYDTVVYLDGPWKVSTAESKEYPTFTEKKDINSIGNLNKPGSLPRFSGTIRYETEFDADSKVNLMLDLGDVGETAQVFVNGSECGIRISPPYRFDISEKIVCGINHLTVDVTNTLVYKMHDRLSSFQAIAPSGLIGPVSIMSGANSKKRLNSERN